jgi:hypothetical protein
MKMRSLMAATIVAYCRKPSRMMPSSSRDEKNLPASDKLKRGIWTLPLNAPSALVKQKIFKNSGQQSRRKSLTSLVFGSPAPVNGGAAN